MDALAAEARRWVDAGGAPASVHITTAVGALPLAWALKDACHAAWSSEPQRTALAAAALADLVDLARRAPSEPSLPSALAELEALGHWTAAIAALAGGQMQAALSALDAAAAGLESVGRTAQAAQTQVPRIVALTMLGRHAEAVACAERAQRRFVALGDRLAAAKVSLNLGSLHLRHDAHAEAARHYREATVLFARIGDREHSVMADIGVADALTALGDFEDAQRLYARAHMRASRHGLPVLEALANESQALLDLARGNLRGALAGLECARRGYERLAMPQHLAIAEKQLGDAYLELRLLPEALALYDSTLARFEALQMPDDQAWTLAQRGRALALSADPAGAAASFEAAARLFESQQSRVGALAIALARAQLALVTNDLPAAVSLATQAAAGLAEAGLVEAEARARLTVAEACLCQGDAAAAQAGFERVLERAGALPLRTVEVHALTGAGLAALAANRRAEARHALLTAVERFEELRRALPGDDIRRAFLTDHLRPFEALLRLALADHAAAPTRTTAADVLRWLDRHRARALDERLLQQAGGLSRGEESTAVTALRVRLNWLQRRLQRLHEDGESAPDLDAAVRSGEQALLEQSRRERLQRPAPPGRADDDVAADGDLADALQARLGAGDALVEYGVADGWLVACVVRRDRIEVRPALAPIDAVRAALRSARFQVDALRHGTAALAGHLPQLTERAKAHLGRLHALIWAPLADAVDDCGRVLVVAPAALGGLPFAALHDGTGPVGERHEIALALSARLACHALRRLPGKLTRPLVVGEGHRLAHAESEAATVARMLPGSRLIAGSQASVAAFEAQAGQADLLHLACHAVFRADNPMFSTLELHDAPLHAERVELLALRPAIVVLSACESGLAADGPGDEHVGLVRAFFAAGAARVIASLWPVDDAVTAAFMVAFYRALDGGRRSPASALGDAQRVVRARHPHPYFWAAFSLYGAW